MGRWVGILIILAVVACEQRYGTHVDPATLGYNPCVATGDCTPLAGDSDLGQGLPDAEASGDAVSPGVAGLFKGRWAMIETQAVTTVDMPVAGLRSPGRDPHSLRRLTSAANVHHSGLGAVVLMGPR